MTVHALPVASIRAHVKFRHDDALRTAEEHARRALELPPGDWQGRGRLHREALEALGKAVAHTARFHGRDHDPSMPPAPVVAHAVAHALEVLLAADRTHLPLREVVAAIRAIDATAAQIPRDALLNAEVRAHLNGPKYAKLAELVTAAAA